MFRQEPRLTRAHLLEMPRGASTTCVSSHSADTRVREGSTSSHANAPRRHSAAATRNDAVQPNRAAIAGVSEAVTAPPICAPVFMKPETEPEERPAISAVTDQNELCAR